MQLRMLEIVFKQILRYNYDSCMTTSGSSPKISGVCRNMIRWPFLFYVYLSQYSSPKLIIRRRYAVIIFQEGKQFSVVVDASGFVEVLTSILSNWISDSYQSQFYQSIIKRIHGSRRQDTVNNMVMVSRFHLQIS